MVSDFFCFLVIYHDAPLLVASCKITTLISFCNRDAKTKNERIFIMKNITYTERNGILYPNLALPEKTNYTLGKYANLRLDFIKKHRRGKYTTLLTEGRLNEYLHAIDIRAHELLDDIIPRLAQERGIDEDLKAHNALLWIAEMNNIKASAEEIVLQEVVYQ